MTNYDASSVPSISQHAEKLIGKSLAEAVNLPSQISDSKNKGRLGDLVEEYWFNISPSNVSHLPDFPDAGLELKTSGVKKGKDGEFRAKERLVLTKINPIQIRDETWETSTFLKKCRLILILFYLYEKDKKEIDREFVLQPYLLDILKLEPQELTQVIRDWTVIRDKCAAHRAHELSEGDTTYLKACRKGSGGEAESSTKQGIGSPPAKGRAFSFPASFMSRKISSRNLGLAPVVVSDDQTVEDSTKQKLQPWLGKSRNEISREIGFQSSAKNRNSQLVKKLLTGNQSVPAEFAKAEIVMRTITVDYRGIPTEDMPFGAFDPKELVEESWEESELLGHLETRYLIAVFQTTRESHDPVLTNAGFWTMAYGDRLASKEIWEQAKQNFLDGAYEALPKSESSPMVFVRTHGQNKEDKVLTARGDWTEKRSFWLGRHYLTRVLRSELTW